MGTARGQTGGKGRLDIGRTRHLHFQEGCRSSSHAGQTRVVAIRGRGLKVGHRRQHVEGIGPVQRGRVVPTHEEIIQGFHFDDAVFDVVVSAEIEVIGRAQIRHGEASDIGTGHVEGLTTCGRLDLGAEQGIDHYL